eukprot:3468329-Alexandrium_andersonii.AAC.1
MCLRTVRINAVILVGMSVWSPPWQISRTCNIARGIRSLSCTAPETTSNSVPGAHSECVLGRCAR